MKFEVGDRVYLRFDQRPTGTIVAGPHRHLGYLCVVVRLDGSGLRVLSRLRDVRPVEDKPAQQGAHHRLSPARLYETALDDGLDW